MHPDCRYGHDYEIRNPSEHPQKRVWVCKVCGIEVRQGEGGFRIIQRKRKRSR